MLPKIGAALAKGIKPISESSSTEGSSVQDNSKRQVVQTQSKKKEQKEEEPKEDPRSDLPSAMPGLVMGPPPEKKEQEQEASAQDENGEPGDTEDQEEQAPKDQDLPQAPGLSLLQEDPNLDPNDPEALFRAALREKKRKEEEARKAPGVTDTLLSLLTKLHDNEITLASWMGLGSYVRVMKRSKKGRIKKGTVLNQKAE